MTLFEFFSAAARAWIVSSDLFINSDWFGPLFFFLTTTTCTAILRKITFGSSKITCINLTFSLSFFYLLRILIRDMSFHKSAHYIFIHFGEHSLEEFK